MNDIVIFGAGGFGREVACLIDEINMVEKHFNLIGFIDDSKSLIGNRVNGYPVLGDLRYLKNKKGVSVAIALGNPVLRMKVLKSLESCNLLYPNVIHPSVMIGSEVLIGIGNIICAGSILTVNISIGSFCQLNVNSTVTHDCVIEDFATTACGVDVAGYSHTGFAAYLGNHSTVLQSIRVGAFATVGAGAVVNRDLPPGVTAVGVPAKVIKQSSIYDEMKNQIPEWLSLTEQSRIRQSVLISNTGFNRV